MEMQQAKEQRRLEELYRDMGDVEIEGLAREAYALTDLAKQVLQAEIRFRKMDLPLRDAPVQDKPRVMTGLGLIAFRKVNGMDEARWLKGILERAGVASCLGPENLSRVEDFRGSFDGGVDLRIFEADLSVASQATRGFFPVEPSEEEEGGSYEVRCPQCHSDEILFEGRDGEPDAEPGAESMFNWSCDACGHQWKDDGIEEARNIPSI